MVLSVGAFNGTLRTEVRKQPDESEKYPITSECCSEAYPHTTLQQQREQNNGHFKHILDLKV